MTAQRMRGCWPWLFLFLQGGMHSGRGTAMAPDGAAPRRRGVCQAGGAGADEGAVLPV
nr:MAG TPA: hypothetical protein [Caudoviricetes sp.]